MSILQREGWVCPFCEKGIIEVLVKPSFYSIKKSWSAAAGSKSKRVRHREEIVILTEKCPVCGKSAKEIKQEWCL
jgi:hypothetical protein